MEVVNISFMFSFIFLIWFSGMGVQATVFNATTCDSTGSYGVIITKAEATLIESIGIYHRWSYTVFAVPAKDPEESDGLVFEGANAYICLNQGEAPQWNVWASYYNLIPVPGDKREMMMQLLFGTCTVRVFRNDEGPDYNQGYEFKFTSPWLLATASVEVSIDNMSGKKLACGRFPLTPPTLL